MALKVNVQEDAKRIAKAIADNYEVSMTDEAFGEMPLLDRLDEALDVRCALCDCKITLLTLAVMGMCGDCEDDHLETRF